MKDGPGILSKIAAMCSGATQQEWGDKLGGQSPSSGGMLSLGSAVDTSPNYTILSPHNGWWRDAEEDHVTMDTAGLIDEDNGAWIMSSAVIVFMMQIGFGILESGCVQPKNEVNIMVKNALDVVFGGLSYWAFGFGFSFGNGPGTNPFIGVGCFFVDASGDIMGEVFAVFLFQLSFSTAATTIVSGAMAERVKLHGYLLFSMLNCVTYSVVAHWLWSDSGFLHRLGAVDIAGGGPVHLVGGITGLVATVILGPRRGVFDHAEKPPLPSPLKAILGMFMLWWGWLRFCSGSVFIVTSGDTWKQAVKAAVNTIVSSMGGGVSAVITSIIVSKVQKKSLYDIGLIINGVMGSLVSITAICTLCMAWEAFLIGAIGSLLASATDKLLWKLKVDDPVGVIPVHATCSIWGLIAVGLFANRGDSSVGGGVFRTGSFHLLGIQALSVVVIIVWTIIIAITLLKIIDWTVGLRLDPESERLGADRVEHGVSLAGFFRPNLEAAKCLENFFENNVRAVARRSDATESLVASPAAVVENGKASSAAKNEDGEGISPLFHSKMSNFMKDLVTSCDSNNLLLQVTDDTGNAISLTLDYKGDIRARLNAQARADSGICPDFVL